MDSLPAEGPSKTHYHFFFCRCFIRFFLVIPLWADQTFGLNAFEIGLWFTIYPFAACVTSFLGAYLCVSIGRSKTVILGNLSHHLNSIFLF